MQFTFRFFSFQKDLFSFFPFLIRPNLLSLQCFVPRGFRKKCEAPDEKGIRCKS